MNKMFFLSSPNFIERHVIFRGIQNVCWCHSQKKKSVKEKYYVVIKGQVPGIYTTWTECEKQVQKFSNSLYKSFTKKGDALWYLEKELNVLKEHPPEDKKMSNHSLEKVLAEYKDIWKDEYTNANKSPLKTVDSTNPNSSCLTFDDDGYLEVYTDGACSRNGKMGAVAGVGVYFGDESELNISAMSIGKPTNNVAEINAVIMGLIKARDAGYKKIKIMTDSEYVMNCLTLWIKKWKLNSWRKANGQFVLNKEVLVELDEIISEMDVKLVHVRGHRDVEGNLKADELARNGIKIFNEEKE